MPTADTLSLDELARLVATQLRELGIEAAGADARVSAVPDARTVRYYTTLGLLDRPTIVNRQARYGQRHVRQLVAIKALQADGQPLATIQRQLYGRTDRELQNIVGTAAGGATAKRQARRLAVVSRREVTIAPGLRLVADQDWTPDLAAARELEQRIKAAIAALSAKGDDE
jgi:DNA-binding transcriptional MerR regulator